MTEKVKTVSRHQEASPSALTLLWQRAVVAVMVGAAAQVQRLSPAAAGRLGSGLGDIAYRLAIGPRRRARANLNLALGDELSDAAREQLVRQVFRHFGRAVVTFLRSPKTDTHELDRQVSCSGWEHAEAALAQGRGLLFVTGHIGDWEILGRWLAQVKNLPLTVVAKDPKQPAFAAYLRRMREGAGFAVRSKGDSPLPLLKALRRNEALCLLPDQNSGDLFVPFFGVPAGTVAGPAALALRSGAALVPIYCLREVADPNFYRITCLPPLAVEQTGDAAADQERIMAAVNRSLEEVIREAPAQWLWLHNRWKSAFEEKNRERAWAGAQDSPHLARARERWEG